MNNFGNNELREAAQQLLDAERINDDANAGTFNEAVTNPDINSAALPVLADFGGLQFPVNSIPVHNVSTGAFGMPDMQNGTLPGTTVNNLPTGSNQPPLMPNGPLGTLQGTTANYSQIAPIATPNVQQNGTIGALPGLSPDLIAQILRVKNIQAMLSSYTAAPVLSPIPVAQRLGASNFSISGLPTPSSLTTGSSSMTNSSVSSLASSASATPTVPGYPPNAPSGNGLWNLNQCTFPVDERQSSQGIPGSSTTTPASLTSSASSSPSIPNFSSNAPSVNGLWNNISTNWLIDPAFSSFGLNTFPSQVYSGILSPASSAMTTSSSSSLMSSTNVSPALQGCLPIAPNLNDPIQNGYLPWNNSQLGLMNLNSSLYAPLDSNATGLGTFLAPETTFKAILQPIKKPKGRKKRGEVRNAVDRYRRDRIKLLETKMDDAPITVGTLEYDKQLEKAKEHYLKSEFNKNEYLKTILHFLSPNLINPFSDPHADFPRKKSLCTPTPGMLYREWTRCNGGNLTYKKFDEIEEEKGEEYAKWYNLAGLVRKEVLDQIEKGFITGAVLERRRSI